MADDYRCLGGGYPCGQCTSFAQWRIVHTLGIAKWTSAYGGGQWLDAWTWAKAARVAGVPTFSAPRIGDIAVWPQGWAGSSVGHVAYVVGVGAGTVTVEDYNWDFCLCYHLHTVSSASATFVRFHPAAVPAPNPPATTPVTPSPPVVPAKPGTNFLLPAALIASAAVGVLVVDKAARSRAETELHRAETWAHHEVHSLEDRFHRRHS